MSSNVKQSSDGDNGDARALLEALADAAALLEPETGHILALNQAMARLLEPGAQVLPGPPLAEAPPGQPLADQARCQAWPLPQGGGRQWVEVSHGLASWQGRPAVLAVVRDIHRQRLAEERQRRLEISLTKRVRELDCLYNLLSIFEAPDASLEEVFQGIVDHIGVGWQPAGQACARLTLEGRTWTSCGFDEPAWRQSTPIRLQGQEAGLLEVGYRRQLPLADEGPFLLEERVLLEVVAGRLGRHVERRRFGDRLARQLSFAQTLVETAQAIVLVLDGQGHIVHFNSFLEKLCGYRLSDVRGHAWEEVFLPAPLEGPDADFFKARAQRDWSRPLLVDIQDAQGGLHRVEWRNQPLSQVEGLGLALLCTGQDLTSRLALEEERHRLAAVVEQTVDSVTLTNRQGCIVYANPAFLRLHGGQPRDVLGQMAPPLDGQAGPGVAPAKVWHTLTAGQSWTGQHFICKGDGEKCQVETTISPIRDASGQIINYCTHHRDISQEEKLRQHLRQAHKMEAIGTLAGGIAHDFNNILGAISGYAELARMSLDNQQRASEFLGQCLKACQRSKDLVRQILTFSRQSEQEKRPVDLGMIVAESLKLMRATLPTTIEMVQRLPSQPAMVMADSTQLQQVVLNLCTNASHAMRDHGGILDVALKQFNLPEHDAPNYPGLAPGPHFRLTFSDTGHGMTPEVMERIFDPFFSTKPAGEGTGLGLAVVHGIIAGNGGTIRVYSEPSRGSTFHVFLPELKASGSVDPEEEGEVPGGGESILLVDDEEALVDILASMLGGLGYRVRAMTSSQEALQLFREHPDEFDLVITDLTMPGMTGLDLTQALLELKPSLPVILCTGFSESASLEKAKSMGVREIILKPVLRGDLARAVRRHLTPGG